MSIRGNIYRKFSAVIVTENRFVRFLLITLLFLKSMLIIASSPLKVKGDNNYPPYEFINKKGEPDGFNVEITRAVANRMGLKVDISLDTWSQVRKELENGDIDILMGMFNTEKRRRYVDFTIPHFVASYSVFVKEGSEIKSISDVKNHSILVQKGDLGYDYLVEQKLTNRIMAEESTEAAILRLAEGAGDCALISRLQGIILLKKRGLKDIKTVGEPIIQRKYCFAVKKGNSALLAQLNEGLSIIKTSGEYDKIYHKWFGVYELTGWNYKTILKYTGLIVTPLILIIIAIFLWTWSLKKRVDQKTRELRESRENLKITLNSIGDGVIATDIEGSVTRMNPVAEQLTGWNLKEAKSKPLTSIFKIVNNLTGEQVDNPVDKVIATGEIVGLANHTVLISKSGKEYQIADSGAPIKNNEGEITGVVLVFRDVTEEYALQEQLRHSQKMDAIGQLAGGVAHDFNNLLTGIIGAAQLLEVRNREFDKKSSDAINIILQAASRASDLTFKLLAFSRKGKIASSAIDLNNIIGDTISILSSTIDKRISIRYENNSERTVITGDNSELQNALINIGINASHAMPEGGIIRLSTENVQLRKSYCEASNFNIEPGEYVEISIIDTGCGIPPENLKKIFEPFFTTKEQGKGTGLGLAAVYGTVLDHKGEISVYSEPGKGTAFNILLPCATNGVKKTETSYEIKKGVGTILLVDDEEIIRVTGALMLQQMGYKVINATNGREAVEIFETEHKNIDLVIMDMIMPDMNGSEAFHRMRKKDTNCKVVISSGFAKDENLEDLKKAGLAGFIRKPYRDFEMSQIISQLISS